MLIYIRVFVDSYYKFVTRKRLDGCDYSRWRTRAHTILIQRSPDNSRRMPRADFSRPATVLSTLPFHTIAHHHRLTRSQFADAHFGHSPLNPDMAARKSSIRCSSISIPPPLTMSIEVVGLYLPAIKNRQKKMAGEM